MFKRITLDNGLRILTAPMQGTNTVTILVMCKTGSDNEAKEVNGISHFLEHMFFKGTTNRPNPERIREELDSMGSISNAFTAHEATGYFIKAGKLYSDAALEMLADIYKHSLFLEEEIEREKQVVIEEMHLHQDTPSIHVWRLWERLLYGDHPAGWEISGEEATIRQLARKDFVSYFNSQYVAANTAVIVSGNIDEDKMVSKIKELFGDIRHSEPRGVPELVENQTTPLFASEKKKIDQTQIVVGFRGYTAFHKDRYAADVLATVLGGSMSSRMFSRIREKLGLAYQVFSESENHSNRGYFATYAGVAHTNVEKTVRSILEEYRVIRETPVSPTELIRTKDFLKGRLLMALETSNAVASFVGGEETLTGKPLTPEEVFAKLDQVTIGDLSRIAKETFKPERLNVVVLGPKSEYGSVQRIIESYA